MPYILKHPTKKAYIYVNAYGEITPTSSRDVAKRFRTSGLAADFATSYYLLHYEIVKVVA